MTGEALRRSLNEATTGWLQALWSAAATKLPEPSGGRGGVALVGVGGTGRGDRAPGSDLDLVVVYDDQIAEQPPGEFLDALWYPIWDSGVALGHSVRSIEAFLELAAGDLETATSLFSMRHLAGDEVVTKRLADQAERQRETLGQQWLRQLVERTDERRRSAGDVAHELEPDLKEGKGGLRDVHTLGWVQTLGVELPAEVADLIAASGEVLWAVRAELHRATGRPGNQLVLQEQGAVADRLGYGSADALARAVSAAAREVSWVLEDLWPELTSHRRRVPDTDVVLRDDPDLAAEVVRVGDEVMLAGQWHRISDARWPEADGTQLGMDGDVPAGGAVPQAIADTDRNLTSVLRLGAVAAERGLRLRRDTLIELTGLPPIPEPWDAQARRLFCRLVGAGPPAVRVVEALDRVGLFAAILPEWEPVRCAPQRNPYHRFTVDRHLIECAANAAALAGRVDRPDLLVLGALFHDLGKGRPGDHSKVGATLARGAMERMGFPPREVEVVVTMVAHHLLLPDVATRRDLDDPATVTMVTDTIGSVAEVRLLAALAEADGRATGSTAWGSWKAVLVRTLADRAVAELAGVEATEDAPLAAPLGADPEVEELLASRTPVLSGEGDRLVVCWPDRTGLFARVAGVLALRNAQILAASASSSDGWAVEVFRIRTPTGEPPRWELIVEDLRAALDSRLALRARLAERAQAERRRDWPGTMDAPTVDFDEGTGVTVIEVAAADRIGLAFSLASALDEMDCSIVKATLTTLGPNAVDTFSVTDADGTPVTDPTRRDALRQALVHAAAG
ncbi:MAG: HD domain-containing protein [Microthrixaceae bacterium]|nr:HD domain-containing protein [Microthrixaceae bacterium]